MTVGGASGVAQREEMRGGEEEERRRRGGGGAPPSGAHDTLLVTIQFRHNQSLLVS